MKIVFSARLCSVFFFFSIKEVTCTTPSVLVSDLLTGYNRDLRPYCNGGEKTTLTLDIAFRQLIDVNEPDQSIRVSVWIRMYWVDCHLTWNPADYNNISYLVLPYNNIWVPDLTFYDSISPQFYGLTTHQAYISSQGHVTYIFPTTQESPCELNVREFPFDEQTCILKFGSWIYNGNEVDIVYRNPYADIRFYVKSVEWNIISVDATRNVLIYGCCPEPYPDITYYLKVKRKPDFYLLNLLLPPALLTVMAVLGFFLPVESGEKIGYTITLMLSLAVFQLLLIDTMPPSADNIPLIAVYVEMCVALVAIASVSTVTAMALYYKGDSPMRPWVRCVFTVYLAHFLCLRRRVKRKQVSPEQNEDYKKNIKTILVVPADKEEGTMPEDENSEKDEEADTLSLVEEWKLVARVVERIGLIVFTSSFTLSTICIIGLLKS